MNPLRRFSACLALVSAGPLAIYTALAMKDPDTTWQTWVQIGALNALLVAITVYAVVEKRDE